MKQLPPVPVKMDYFALKGGLNQTSPPLTMPPGFAVDAINWECDINGGYSRIKGYERYDGHAQPSDALLYTIPTSTAGAWNVGDTITGGSSGATATYIATTASGLIVTKVTGTFAAEPLTPGGGVATGSQYLGGAESLSAEATYRNRAADVYRALIAVVPGSGGILGVKYYAGALYALRNNVGGTAAEMYKSATSGWTAVALGREMYFTSGGTYEVEDGDTITGATSGKTATVTRVVLESGSWAAGTAAGRFIFATESGVFQAAETLNVGANINVATVTAASVAITLAPSGRYVFDVHSFTGAINSERMYGASGVHRGFEFDGSVFVPINTGMTTDTPTHVIVHNEQVFFAFGASVQHSGISLPYEWSPVIGAGEIAVGDSTTGFVRQPGSTGAAALMIVTRNKAFALYGNNASDWVLTVAQEDAGAIAYTLESLSGILALDDRGVTFIGTSQNYGNFEQSTITRQIQPLINQQRGLAISSTRVREKNQYRLFYSDKRAISITMQGNKLIGIMPQLYAHDVLCTDSSELSDGTEGIFFGSTDGYVYRAERGTSFDGSPIEWSMVLAYNNLKSPQVNKRYRKMALEITGESYVQFTVGYQLGYNNNLISQAGTTTGDIDFASNNWDNFIWDAFIWDGTTLLPEEVSLEGTAENIAVTISGSSDEYDAFTVTGALLQYTPRTRIR